MNMTHDFQARADEAGQAARKFVAELARKAGEAMTRADYARAVIDAIEADFDRLRFALKQQPDASRASLAAAAEWNSIETLLMLAKDQCERAIEAAEPVAQVDWPGWVPMP